jgi:tRNA pseudouridine13 synthase
MGLPHVTTDLPGTGGGYKVTPEDFRVDEIPAYLPSGEGDHTFLLVEKRGLDTREVVRAIARALSVREGDVGVAGQKDRFALSTQWISVPRVDPDRALAVAGEGFRILEAKRHGNKLRTGHNRGNRFRLRIRGGVPDAAARARAVAAALAARGLPNFYGPQRFGRTGDNAELGRLLLRGEEDGRLGRARRDPKLRRLLISAFQSEVFNRVLARRLADGTWIRPLAGDVLEKCASGGLFVCAEPEVDGPRVATFELSVTGPMPGPRVRPAPTGEPAALEAAVLAETGVTPEQLGRSRDAEGARRALRIRVEPVVEEDAEGVVLSFALPSGSYATVVLDEVIKPGQP